MTDPSDNHPSDNHPSDSHPAGPPHPADADVAAAAVEAATRPVGLRSSGALDSVVSVVLFMVGNRLGGLGLAIGLATVWALFAALRRVRSGRALGKLLPLTTAYLVARGVVGIATDSKAVYFGIGIGTKVAIGLALLLTVVVRRPVLAWALPYVLPFPAFVRAHARYLRTAAVLTAVAGVYELGSSAWDIWLYHNSSTNGFVLIRFLVGWLSGFVTIFGSIFYADWSLRKIPGFEGLLPMMEDLATSMGTATMPAGRARGVPSTTAPAEAPNRTNRRPEGAS